MTTPQSPATDELKYGERAIAEGELITFPNPSLAILTLLPSISPILPIKPWSN